MLTPLRSFEPFKNPARSDGLVLRHWQRKQPNIKIEANPTNERDTAGQADLHHNEPNDMPVYPFAKYNIKPRFPSDYSEEQYNQYFQSENWSRSETDYLMNIVKEFDLRWAIISDRYQYSSPNTSEVPRRRTMEDLKARYYYVAAKMLSLQCPPREMSQDEFYAHEKMLKYDPDQERVRKELAVLQLNRSKEEVQEETILLEELRRIVANEDAFMEERKELYGRLEAPPSTANTAAYQTSQGLAQLLSSLLQADKSKKRRSLLGSEMGVPYSGSQSTSSQQAIRDNRSDTPTTSAGLSNKKSNAATSSTPQHIIKTLTPAEEAKYGVSHHEKISSGVQFRNDRAQKLTQAKSNIQSQKLASALTELDIPPRLLMPTESVCREFEKMISSVNVLLDTRKLFEKVEGEIRVLQAGKKERERKEREKPTSGKISEENEARSPGREGHLAYALSQKSQDNIDTASNNANLIEAGSETSSNKGVSPKRSASETSIVSEKNSKRARR